MESSRRSFEVQQLHRERTTESSEILIATAALEHDVASMPGFRFQPTEEELVGFYLRSMVVGDRLEVELINVLDLYRYDPWELPAMAFMQGEREWLFFCPREKKYPNGERPNRVTASGYWKATGTDRQVRRAHDARCIGLKKTLVFYSGKAPHGRKTEWIMNEYRLLQSEHIQPIRTSSRARKDPREVTLCRIYKKPAHHPVPSYAAHAPEIILTEDPFRSSTYHFWSQRASTSAPGTSHAPLLKPTPDHVEDKMEALRSAHLMHAGTRRRQSIFAHPTDDEPISENALATTNAAIDVAVSAGTISEDQFSWLRQSDRCALVALPGEGACALAAQPASCGNLSFSASMDWLLKFSSNGSHSRLADRVDNVNQPFSAPRIPSNLATGWSSCTPTSSWLQSI